MSVDKVHLRHCILYEFQKGSITSIACKNLCAVFGKDIVNVRICQRWFSKFRTGDLSLQESYCYGQPFKIDNDVLRSMLENNPHLTSREIAEEFGIHHTTVGDHIKSLGNIISNSSKTKYQSMKNTDLFVVGQERSSVLRVAETGKNQQCGSVLCNQLDKLNAATKEKKANISVHKKE
ncbi:histone-lysine N-methyltransferase SETMAR [Trichonephila clavipes]|nr:histone-lysine N-methyltransferase SETMAR [Trichonephila clavipes]